MSRIRYLRPGSHPPSAARGGHRRTAVKRLAAATATAVLFAAAAPVLALATTATPDSTTESSAPEVSAPEHRTPVSWAQGPRQAARWRWPLPSHDIDRPYRAPDGPYAAGHRGIDLIGTVGEAVRAPADGTIAFAGPVAGRTVVVIDHGDGLRSTLEPVTDPIALGSRIAAGDRIGDLSADGRHCENACLHLGARIGENYVSPLAFLEPAYSILLPLAGEPIRPSGAPSDRSR